MPCMAIMGEKDSAVSPDLLNNLDKVRSVCVCLCVCMCLVVYLFVSLAHPVLVPTCFYVRVFACVFVCVCHR